MALHELPHGYFPQERSQNGCPSLRMPSSRNRISQDITRPVSKMYSLQAPFCRLQFPVRTLLQHWLSKGCSFRVVICFTVDLHGKVFIVGCRGISTPLSGSPPPSSSLCILVSAEYFSHITLTPLSQLLSHRSLCPNCLNFKNTVFLQLFKMSSTKFSVVLSSLQLQPVLIPVLEILIAAVFVICHKYNPAISIYSCQSLCFFVLHKYPVRKSSINYSILPFFCFFQDL